MKISITLTLIIITLNSVQTQSTFFKKINPSSNFFDSDYGVDIEENAGKLYITTNSLCVSGPDSCQRIVVLDEYGSIDKVILGPYSDVYNTSRSALAESDSLFIVGRRYDSVLNNKLMIAYVNLNQPEYISSTFTDTSSLRGYSFIRLNDSTFVVAGSRLDTNEVNAQTGLFLAHFNTDLEVYNFRIIRDSLIHSDLSIIQGTNTGKFLILFVGDRILKNIRKKSLVLIQVDELGNIDWYKYYNNVNYNRVQPRFVATNDGNFIISWTKDTSLLIDGKIVNSLPYIMKINSSGEIIWEKEFVSGEKAITEMKITDGGNIYGVGYYEDPPSVAGWCFKLDNDGKVFWERNYYDTNTENNYLFLYDIEVLENGDIAMVGEGLSHIEGFGFVGPDIAVLVVDSNGCLDPDCHSDDIVVTTQDDYIYLMDHSIYPNPASDYFDIIITNEENINLKDVSIKVYNGMGSVYSLRTHTMSSVNTNELNLRSDISGISAGVYFVIAEVIIENVKRNINLGTIIKMAN